MTASLDELKQALVETLDSRGVLGQVKAKVRAEIFAALDDEQVPRPQLPPENVIINELIREYFQYNGYHHSLSVMLPESGHPEEKQFDRRFLASELHVQEDERSRSLPLIYALVRGLKSQEGAGGASASASSSAAPPVALVIEASSAPVSASHPNAPGAGRQAAGYAVAAKAVPAAKATAVRVVPATAVQAAAASSVGGDQPPAIVIPGSG